MNKINTQFFNLQYTPKFQKKLREKYVCHGYCGLPKRQTCLFNKLGNKLRPDIEYQNKPNG